MALQRKLILLLFTLLCTCSGVNAQPYQTETLTPTEISLTALHSYDHPHRDVQVKCRFIAPAGDTITVAGFWDGGKTYRIRFAPPKEGIWRFTTQCSDTSDSGLHGVEGIIQVKKYAGEDPYRSRGWLCVADNGRHLCHEDGTPWFYLGDTSWEIVWKSTPEQMKTYMQDRWRKGFTAVQIVVMSHQHIFPSGVINRAGEPYLLNEDLSMLNPRYFDYLDSIVATANAYGMVAVLVPLWSGLSDFHYRETHHRFYFSRENALLLARYIAARYAASNVIWIVGGDDEYVTDEQKEFWSTFARTLRRADGGAHLMTVHTAGWTASFDYFGQEADWLDFHMYQSSHTAGGNYTWDAALRGYALNPVKPVLNGEATYEDIYHNLWNPDDTVHPATFRIRPEHVRQASYESILSGALVGITYGGNGVWQWSIEEIPGSHRPTHYVEEAWMMPGSGQMGVLKEFFEARRWYQLAPRPDLLLAADSPEDVPVAISDTFLIAYLPMNTNAVNIDCSELGEGVEYHWVNPATGTSVPGERRYGTELESIELQPPDSNDWLLVVRGTAIPVTPPVPPPVLNYEFLGCVPNPCLDRARIRYILPEAGRLEVTVWDVGGSEVFSLNLPCNSGTFSVSLGPLSAGRYFYRSRYLSGSGEIAESNGGFVCLGRGE